MQHWEPPVKGWAEVFWEGNSKNSGRYQRTRKVLYNLGKRISGKD